VRIHPGGFRLVLVGPKVSRLLPFLQSRGFPAEAFARGGEAQARLRGAPCHLLIVELELGDMLGIELGRAARQDRQAGAVMLMDDPAKSGMIVAALSRGLETFVPIPPDEAAFLERIELLLLAQWGLVVTQQQAQQAEELAAAKQAASTAEEQLALARNDADERLAAAKKLADEGVARLEAQHRDVKKQLDDAKRAVDHAVAHGSAALVAELADERRKVEQLRREAAVLRDQLTSMHLVTGAKSGVSEEGAPAFASDDGVLPADELENEDAPTAKFELPVQGSTALRPGAAPPSASAAAAAFVSPGPTRAPDLRAGKAAAARTDLRARTSSTSTPPRTPPALVVAAGSDAAADDDGFEPRTQQATRSLSKSGATLEDRTAPHAITPGGTTMYARNAPSLAQIAAIRPSLVAPAELFDDDAGATDAPPSAASFKANDESTAPGGHAISNQPELAAGEQKAALQREQARAASPKKPSAVFEGIGDLPAVDDEVLFLEDE